MPVLLDSLLAHPKQRTCNADRSDDLALGIPNRSSDPPCPRVGFLHTESISLLPNSGQFYPEGLGVCDRVGAETGEAMLNDDFNLLRREIGHQDLGGSSGMGWAAGPNVHCQPNSVGRLHLLYTNHFTVLVDSQKDCLPSCCGQGFHNGARYQMQATMVGRQAAPEQRAISQPPAAVPWVSLQDAVGFQRDEETVESAFGKAQMSAQFHQRPSRWAGGETIQNLYQTVDGFDRGITFHTTLAYQEGGVPFFGTIIQFGEIIS
jgi:hypothetical protein